MINLEMVQKFEVMSLDERMELMKNQEATRKNIKMGLALFNALPDLVREYILEEWKSNMLWVKDYDLSFDELLELLNNEKNFFDVSFGDYGIYKNHVMIKWGAVYYGSFEAEAVGSEWLQLAFPEDVEAIEAVKSFENEIAGAVAGEAVATVEADNEEYNYRICDECNEKMYDGYVFEGTGEHFCSDKCLTKNYSPEQYLEMYEDDDAYWTEGFSGWSPNVAKR